MALQLEMPDGSTDIIQVEVTCTVETAKTVIKEQKGIMKTKQCLTFAGKELEDERSLSSYGIQRDSTIQLRLSTEDEEDHEIEIRIKDQSGHVYVLKMKPTVSILGVKTLLQDKQGISPLYQYLLFTGILLENRKTLLDYNIGTGSCLDLIVQSRYHGEYSVSTNGDSGTASPVTDIDLNVDTDSDEDSLDSLPSEFSESQPAPTEMEKAISRLCDKNHVRLFLIIQDPSDCNSVVVTGVGISKIEAEWSELQTNFPDLKVSLQEKDGALFTKHHTRTPTIRVNKKSPTRLQASTWTIDDWATLELFVSAKQMNKDNPEEARGVHAVVPAHLVMNDNQCEEFAKAESCIAIARNEVEQETTRTKYTATIDASAEITDLGHPPLFGYRHWAPEESDRKFMNDLALLNFNRLQAIYLQSDLKQINSNRIERIKVISSAEDLKAMCRRGLEVAIAGAEGRLVPFPTMVVQEAAEQDQRSYGLHLPFILSSKDKEGNSHKLKPGHCGSILFYKKSSGKLMPMGLFVGELDVTFPSGTIIYQAIVLSEALREIETDYPHQVSNIQPFK